LVDTVQQWGEPAETEVSTGLLVWVSRVSGLAISGFGAAAVVSINF
jgi:hypothetical protein